MPHIFRNFAYLVKTNENQAEHNRKIILYIDFHIIIIIRPLTMTVCSLYRGYIDALLLRSPLC